MPEAAPDAPFALPIPLEWRRSSRARRLTLRLDTVRQRIVVTMPKNVAQARAAAFLMGQRAWLMARVARLSPPCPFEDGASVPIRGEPHRIASAGRLRGRVEAADGVVTVPGAPEHLPRRLTDYLKAEARRDLSELARAKAERIGCRIGAIGLRDTRSRWGSCSAAGRLNFSWRLILAPPFVLDYVVAHEVAHLAEMNHGTEFWALCASLTEDAMGARAWLKANGPGLHRYG